jgi:hypothetical protein
VIICDAKVLEENQPGWRDIFARHRQIISYVRSPLGFYTLALLIVEGFLLGAGALFHLEELIRVYAMATGVLLFVGVVATVTVLVIKFPKALVFSEDSHLEWQSMQVFGDNSRPIPGRLLEDKKGTEPPEKPLGQLSEEDREQ